MILTALFLAAKTENSFIPIQYFKSQLPSSVDTSQLTSLEFPLSQGMQFSYTVWSCLRPLWGFGLDITDLLNEGALDFDKDSLMKILDDARHWGMESLRTDAQFLFTPPQIALSCIFHYSPILVQEFLAIKFPRGRVLSPVTGEREGKVKQEDARDVLLRTIEACDTLISERIKLVQGRTKEETVNLVKGIDKKLYQSRKLLDSLEADGMDTAKRKTASPPEERDVKRAKVE
jgi:cyclin H